MQNFDFSAQLTVAVDGGTNRWMDYIGEQKKDSLLRGECKDYLPTLVTGKNLKNLFDLKKMKLHSFEAQIIVGQFFRQIICVFVTFIKL